MKETASTQGSDIVLRGLMLLALMTIVVLAGFAIFFRRATQPAPVVTLEPEPLISMLVQPASSFPGTLAWGPMLSFVEELPSEPGWRIRYQAARNLAHRGSASVPWNTYREMLDEQQQLRNFRIRLEDGRLITEEAAARQIIIGALKDLSAWHGKHKGATPSPELREVYAAVDTLAKSPILELRAQAEKTAATFLR